MTGVILIAFGKRGYGLMARNLALSLRHFAPDLHIVTYADESLNVPNSIPLPKEYFTHPTSGKIDPARAKCQAYRLGIEAGLDRFLFIDVDTVAINDIRPLLDHLKGTPFAIEVTGQGGKADRINYSIWATNPVIWRHFSLCDTATLCGVQSSWMYFEKGPTCDNLQAQLDYYIRQGQPIGGLSMSWGGTMPDELIYAGCLARLGMIPTIATPPKRPMLFGHKRATYTDAEATDQFYLLSLYGNGTGRTLTAPKWFKMHDRLLAQMGGEWFSAMDVMKDKHVNG